MSSSKWTSKRTWRNQVALVRFTVLLAWCSPGFSMPQYHIINEKKRQETTRNFAQNHVHFDTAVLRLWHTSSAFYHRYSIYQCAGKDLGRLDDDGLSLDARLLVCLTSSPTQPTRTMYESEIARQKAKSHKSLFIYQPFCCCMLPMPCATGCGHLRSTNSYFLLIIIIKINTQTKRW